MPTNLYGPNDNFDLESSHVIPGLMRKFHEAKLSGASQVSIWGTGEPMREFLHVDDLASAVLFLLQSVSAGDVYRSGISHINIGSGEEMSIRDLAEMIKRIVGFEGRLVFDTSKPDGTPRKFLDSSRIRKMGWSPTISLEDGLRSTYERFRQSSPTRGLSNTAESE
jgi:GDP-L-fucose synthase